MSESAANVKLFFPFHSCLESIQADTLLPDGAEDKALLGSNLSADSGAKTRLGFRASWTPAVRFENTTGIGINSDKIPGVWGQSPHTYKIASFEMDLTSIALDRCFRSFVGHMSPPSISA